MQLFKVKLPVHPSQLYDIQKPQPHFMKNVTILHLEIRNLSFFVEIICYPTISYQEGKTLF